MSVSKEAIEAFALAFWPVNAVSKMESCSGDIAKALEAALPFLPIAVEGKVKALEWQRNEAGSWFAHTAFGVYLVNKGRWWIKSTTPLIDRGDDETAKSAAQADYVQRVLSCLASSPGKDGGQEVEAAQITMGRGLVDVTRIEHEGRSGILFRPRAEHIPVGEEGELQPGEYWPVKGDVVIWIENKGGARVIQNYLSAFMPSEQAAVSETSTAEKAAQIAERYNIDPWIVREIRALDTQPASTAQVERLAERFDRIATIIDRNLYHQHEKIEDAKSIAVQMREELRALPAAQPAVPAALAIMTQALEKCQKALAAMIAPDAIKQTTVINAFAMATEAEASARAALSASQSTSREGER